MKTLIIVIIVLLAVFGIYWLNQEPSATPTPTPTTTETATTTATSTDTSTQTPVDTTKTVIGQSVGGRDITAYHYGTGDKEVLFVGGIHGGYEWNTALVAYQLMDYLDKKPEAIPSGVKVTVIPVLNPDGLQKVAGKTEGFTKDDITSSTETLTAGRFNGNNVDLNRNFDCDWQKSAKWQSKTVSGGESAFSEPETKAMRDYVEKVKPVGALVWYSAAGGVFASNCHNGVLPETTTLTSAYAKASGYPAYKSFNFYEITGDMVNWLAKENIPAISVLLTNHTDTEWSKNQAGIDAILAHYATPATTN